MNNPINTSKKRRGITVIAFGTMDAVCEWGLYIPNNISIIGFDDIPQAALVYPKLTTVRQSPGQKGQIALNMLLKQISNQSHPPQWVTLDTQFVIRDSCGPYRGERKEYWKNRGDCLLQIN